MFSEFTDPKKTEKMSKKELSDKIAALRLPKIVGKLSHIIPQIMIFIIWTLPSIITMIYFNLIQAFNNFFGYILYGLIPLVFSLSFLLIAGIFGQIGRFGIVEGKFPRIAEHPIYALRRIFGGAWTQVYYFKPIYSLFLSIPLLKKILFRLFGYKGNLNFTIYPDTWVRDLVLLKISPGAYLSNRSTIGTNLVLEDQSILVGGVEFGPSSTLGHFALASLGSKIGENTILGVYSTNGIRIQFGDNVHVAPRAVVGHGAKIMNGTQIGVASVIGLKATVGPNIVLPECSIIPPGAHVQTQAEFDSLFTREKTNLEIQRNAVVSIIEEYFKDGFTTRSL